MKNRDSIEDLVTGELSRLLSASPGPDSIDAPLENLCGALEILVPRGLARRHPEWRERPWMDFWSTTFGRPARWPSF